MLENLVLIKDQMVTEGKRGRDHSKVGWKRRFLYDRDCSQRRVHGKERKWQMKHGQETDLGLERRSERGRDE